MKAPAHFYPVAWLISVLLALHTTGCHQGPGMVDAALDPASRLHDPQALGFWPTDATVLPLTVLSVPQDTGSPPYIHLFVGLRDAYGCYTKSPGTYRMELYERMPRSDQARGRRISVWPDIDVTHPDENQGYWRDYLRCYEFRLDLSSAPAQRAATILEVTFLSANAERLTTQYTLEPGD